tara:strand:+ start:628 stop:1680 length:1053 start_codon:yes stop_codon:yes gene_type:complete
MKKIILSLLPVSVKKSIGRIKWKLKVRYGKYFIFIADSFGESFKDFMLDNPVNILKKDLLNGVNDERSVDEINTIIKRHINYPDFSNKYPLKRGHSLVGGKLKCETDEEKNKIREATKTYKKTYKFDKNFFEESVFYYKHGLVFLDSKIKEYIKGYNIFDVGAHNGASAIMFLNEFEPDKVISFEISDVSIDEYKKNLDFCSIPKSSYEIIKTGLTSDSKTGLLKFKDSGSPGLSVKSQEGVFEEGMSEVELKTLDQVVFERGFYPRVIKADIEGACFDMIKGAKETLLKFRPVLSLAIYHNPEEFYFVKPYLENLLPNYKFIFRKLTPNIMSNYIHSEVILIGYPEEII